MKTGILVKRTVLGLALALVGCGKDEFAVDPANYQDFTEIVTRRHDLKNGKSRRYEELKPEDVLVAVNGYPLTKQEYDDRLVAIAKMLTGRKGSNAFVADREIETERMRLMENFIAMRLMIDEGKRRNLMTATNVYEKVCTFVAKRAKRLNKTVEQLEKTYPGDKKYFYYDLAERSWSDEVIAKCIPPKLVVNDEFVSNVMAQVAHDNGEIRKANEVTREALLKLRDEALSGKSDFIDLAVRHSEDEEGAKAEDSGIWGEFERGEMSDRKVQAAVFALKLGEISDVLEDENGYRIVKVLKITPPEKNAKGRVVRHEVRKLAHIYKAKSPEMIVLDKKAMFKDMKHQMQMQAIAEWVDLQKTNGVNTIVYPNGKDVIQ